MHAKFLELVKITRTRFDLPISKKKKKKSPRNFLLVVKAMILKQVLLLFAFRNLWIKKAAHTNNHAEK